MQFPPTNGELGARGGGVRQRDVAESVLSRQVQEQCSTDVLSCGAIVCSGSPVRNHVLARAAQTARSEFAR